MMRPLEMTVTDSQEAMPIASESPQPQLYLVSSSMPESVDPISQPREQSSGQNSWLHSPQNQRQTSQTILWGAMFISALCHGLFLLLPLPENQTKPPSSVAEKTMRVTTLPKKQPPELAVLAKETLPKVEPKALIPPPKPENFPRKSQTAIPKVKPSEPPTQKRTVSPPKQKPAATPPKTVTPPPKTETPPPKTEDETPPPAADTWVDFPSYPNAASGCLDLDACSQTEDDLYKVSGFFEQALKVRKYDFQAIATEAEQKTYKVSRDERTEFLHLFLTTESGTGYILAKEPLDIAELKRAAADGLVDESGDATNIAVDCSQFAEPDLFCENNVKKAEIDTFEWVPDAKVDSLFDEIYRDFFSKNNYKITEDQTYGDGTLYIITKGDERVYINIVPNKEKTGAIIVNWNTLPPTKTL